MATAPNIGISAKQRADVAQGLNKVLADSYALYLKTHGYHWNVRGPYFQSLHILLEGQYNEEWAALDLIAERIRALGLPAPGTYKEFSRLASIQEVEGVPRAEEMIKLLVAAQEATARTARSLFALVDKANEIGRAHV